MKKIIVASKNPVKIKTTQEGFMKMFPEEQFEIEGLDVDSGVPDQPMSEKETLLGAVTRANNAKKEIVDADFWVGIEGGLKEVDNTLEAFNWIVVLDKNEKTGKGRSGSFFLPLRVAKLIKEGKTLGEADDIVFQRYQSSKKNGAVGILTNDVVPRTSLNEMALILALIPFKNPDLY